MQVNPIQNYNNYQSNLKQTLKNQSFGHIVANEHKDFTNVKKMLSSAKFDSYMKHFRYLQGFKLNLKEIMKNVNAIKYIPFNETYSNLSKEQINNCAQKVINSFVKSLGTKARDFNMKFEPHFAKPTVFSPDYDNVFYGYGLASDLNCKDNEITEITPEMISKDKVKFGLCSSYSALVYECPYSVSSFRENHFRLPIDEKSLHDEVRGVLVKHLHKPIDNSLKNYIQILKP